MTLAMPSHDASPSEVLSRQRRLARVALLRRALPVVAGLCVLACIAEIALRSLTAPAAPKASAETPRLISPRYAGTSRDGRSYVVTGREAQRDATDDNLVLIADPVLTLNGKAGKVTKMTALRGVYSEDAHTLLLKDNVQVDNGAGSHFAAERAVVDTRTGAVTGQSGAHAVSDAGQVTSQSYDILDKGDRLVFKGGVRARLAPQK
jgi:lipopolysaccharide export system protein LptC